MCTVFPTIKQNHPHAIPQTKPYGRRLCARPNVCAAAFPYQKYTHYARGFERWMRPCGATRAGTQAPPLPISIIFCHAIPHKQNSVHAQFTPNEINRPCAIRPYQSPSNRTVYPYPIGVILSIAQGWQVQRSLPWVTMQARRLPPWGLYFFSSHIITTCGEWIIRE